CFYYDINHSITEGNDSMFENWQRLSRQEKGVIVKIVLVILIVYISITYLSATSVYKSMIDSRIRHAGKLSAPSEESAKAAQATPGGEAKWWAKDYAEKLSDEGDYVKVKVGSYIDNVEALSIKECYWSTHFYLWFIWHGDKNLDPGGKFLLVDGTINKKELLEEYYGEDGTNYQRYRVAARIIKTFDTSRVPIEDHMLNIYVEDGSRDSNKIRYVADTITISPRVEIPGFKITKSNNVVQAHTYNATYGDPRIADGSKKVFSQYLAAMRISRSDFGFYIEIFLSLFAALFLTILSMLVRASDIGPRLSLATGAYFGAVANTYVANSVLPPSAGEFGLVDHITGIGLLTVAITIGLALLSYHLYVRKEQKELSLVLDRILFLVVGICCLLANLIIPFCARG
ncbi:MAG TPA: hypothetical protein VN611_11605, partial [Patescibacteria group bacterium]|nr:hypothetical protein [Patescibacteria group bacterium]